MHDLIGRVAETDPRRPALVTHDVEVDYGHLDSATRRVAAALRGRGIERVATVDHEVATLVPVLAAGALAGVEVCQYPPVEAAEVGELAERLDHAVVVSPRRDLGGLGLQVIHPDELVTGGTDAPAAPPPPVRRPHLVLTTGTTGAPRGARHDWGRLEASVARVAPAPEQRWLLAFGLHQFAGLQVLLHVFAAGATLVAPAPRRPIEGLAAMRSLGVTHASATPTYWRFLLAQLRSDGGPVPPLEQITLGGEAVPAPVLQELAAVFPDAAVSQVYASSEFGSTSSMRDGLPGLSTAVLDRPADADVRFKIVDGELWICSRTGMLGYHGEPETGDGWRATGDLVEVVDDRILFRGRTSEVINVGGVKVHPLPIEERVAAVPGVEVARVHGRPNAMTGSIVALEVVPAPSVDHDRLRQELRAACADLVPAARPRSIRFVEQIATTGNKIVRREP